MARRTVVEVEVNLEGYSTDDLAKELEDRGCIVIGPGEAPNIGVDLSAVIERRHDEQHAGPLVTCRDEICDALARFGGEQ